MRYNRDTTKLSSFIKDNEAEVFFSYSLAAEIESLRRLGIDTSKMECVDLMVESRMITLSHYSYFDPQGSMLSSLQVLTGKDVKEDKLHKDKMRDLIIYQNSWTDKEWEEIVTYCWSDIDPLLDLFSAIIKIHKDNDHPYLIEIAQARGEYVRMATEMDFASRGFPVYGGSVDKIYGNRDEIKRLIIKTLPPYWQQCYQRNKSGGYTLSRKSVMEVISLNKWNEWKLTDNNLPCLDKEYLKELSLTIPEVEVLRQALKSMVTLNSSDLREQIKAGYIKPRTNGYAAKTSRNGLKPKQGYLLNLPAWMRPIIHPHPGMGLFSVDWSQQEVAIAAALSNDKKMLAAYASGDIYLALAKMNGVIPETGTKYTHRKEREIFKALQLALTYGKGVKSLGKDFWAIMREDGTTLEEATLKASEIFNWHKETFSTYWNWINNQIGVAKVNGWINTMDDWVCWVSSSSRRTALLNFPSQANAAVMMREATKLFYASWMSGNISPVLCSQHDGFYFNIPLERLEIEVPIIEEIMGQASINTIGFGIRCDSELFTNSDSYKPKSWDSGKEKLWEMATSLGEFTL